MRPEIIAVRNKLQPKAVKNTDPQIFDYSFWTDLEKLAKKEREAALETVKKLSTKPLDKSGIILAGSQKYVELQVSNPRQAFDKEVFIDLILKAYPKVERAKLRELATAAVVPGNSSKSFIVKDIDDE